MQYAKRYTYKNNSSAKRNAVKNTSVKNASLNKVQLFFADIDVVLFCSVLILLTIGMCSTFIATFTLSTKLTGNPFYMAYKQSFLLLLGLLAIIFFSFYRLEAILKMRGRLFFASVFLLLLVFLPGIGKEVSGAKRWVEVLGIGFQPSELVKLTTLLFFASVLGKKTAKPNPNYLSTGLPPFILLLMVCALIAIQPDISTAIILFASCMLLFFSSKVPVKYLFANLALTLPFAVVFLQSRRYYLDRLLFFAPNEEPQGRGYHLLQSLSAFKRGEFFGEKVGTSINHLVTLPDAHNDFIFSVIGNVSGVVGVGLVVFLFGCIIVRGAVIAIGQTNLTKHYLALGFTYLLALQAILHMLVTLGLAPTTGISLPFISYGGSSIVVSCIMVGMLLRLSRKKN